MFLLRGSLQAKRKGLETRAWRSEILNLSWAGQARERATQRGRLRDRHGGELSDEPGEAREGTGASEFGDHPSSPAPPHQERENEGESVSAFPAPPGERTGRERGVAAQHRRRASTGVTSALRHRRSDKVSPCTW